MTLLTLFHRSWHSSSYLIIILYFHYVTNFVLVISLPHVILITDFYSNTVMVSHKATCLSVHDCWDLLTIMLFNTMYCNSIARGAAWAYYIAL